MVIIGLGVLEAIIIACIWVNHRLYRRINVNSYLRFDKSLKVIGNPRRLTKTQKEEDSYIFTDIFWVALAITSGIFIGVFIAYGVWIGESTLSSTLVNFGLLMVSCYLIEAGYTPSLNYQEFTHPEDSKKYKLRKLDLWVYRFVFRKQLNSSDERTWLIYNLVYEIFVLDVYKEKYEEVTMHGITQEHLKGACNYERVRVNVFQEILCNLASAILVSPSSPISSMTNEQIGRVAYLEFIKDEETELMDALFSSKGYVLYEDTLLGLDTLSNELNKEAVELKDVVERTETSENDLNMVKGLLELERRKNMEIKIHPIGED